MDNKKFTFAEYVEGALKTAIYPCEYKVTYPKLGLIEESGEVCGKIKKIIRDRPELDVYAPKDWDDEVKKSILLELGDVCWYCAIIATDESKTSTDFDFNRLTIENFKDYAEVDGYYQRDIINNVLNIADISNDIAQHFMLEDINVGKIHPMYMVMKLRDVFARIDAVASSLGYDIETVMTMNLDKLESRRKRNTLHGSGDNR